MREVIPVKCSIVRGGTSKGIFIMENELPRDPELRDKYILEIFGSPDVRQIDGLGGADVLTSKLAIIGPSSREDADVDYTFGQVSFVEPKIDYKSNCGNISAGVAPFAINNGIVKAVEPYTTVRIHQVNTDTIINAKVEVRDGKAAVDGDFHIDGVPTLSSTIELDFSDSVGGITGNAVSYAADVLLGGGPTVSAGASTSVFGLFVAVALLGVLHKGNRHVFAQYSKSMLTIIGINVVYTFLVPGISVSGHLGGALGGLIAMFMIPAKNLRVPLPARVVVAVLWVAAMAWVVSGALGLV